MMTRYRSKICIVCRHRKPLSEFYAHPLTLDKHAGVCKECHGRRMRRRQRRPDVRKYDRERAMTPQRIAMRRQITLRWRMENPQAYKAQTALGNAVRGGRVKKKPCQVCGRKHVHAHHWNYARPLDVIWLCALHHQRLHSKERGQSRVA